MIRYSKISIIIAISLLSQSINSESLSFGDSHTSVSVGNSIAVSYLALSDQQKSLLMDAHEKVNTARINELIGLYNSNTDVQYLVDALNGINQHIALSLLQNISSIDSKLSNNKSLYLINPINVSDIVNTIKTEKVCELASIVKTLDKKQIYNLIEILSSDSLSSVSTLKLLSTANDVGIGKIRKIIDKLNSISDYRIINTENINKSINPSIMGLLNFSFI